MVTKASSEKSRNQNRSNQDRYSRPVRRLHPPRGKSFRPARRPPPDQSIQSTPFHRYPRARAAQERLPASLGQQAPSLLPILSSPRNRTLSERVPRQFYSP